MTFGSAFLQRSSHSDSGPAIRIGRRTDRAENDARELSRNVLAAPTTGVVREPLHSYGRASASDTPLGLGAGEPLSSTIRDFFEPRFGVDFGQVRVHTGLHSAAAATSAKARAMTLGNHMIFGLAEFEADTRSGQELLAHELAHVVQQSNDQLPVIRRAEVDDNPEFCFPTKGGTPLTDIKEVVNKWIASARATTNPGSLAQPAAIYRNLGGSGPRSRIEEMIAVESSTAVRTVKPSESRFAGQEYYPGLAAQLRTRRLAPVVNICGVCVGADKLGHFIQQGYEYFQLEQALRARIKNWSDKERRDFREKITGPPLELPPLLIRPGGETQPPLEIEFPPEFQEDMLIDIYTNEFGKWLEGFQTRLPDSEIKWIKSQSFIPGYYQKGVYGASFSGAMSRADVAANAAGGQFYRDLWRDPSMTPDICNYVASNCNERNNLTTYVTYPRPTGPQSESEVLEFQ